MVKEFSSKLNLKASLILLFGLFGLVCFVRGVWGLSEIYLFPQNFLLSQISSILIGFLILLIVLIVIKHKND